jgi:hypothetical protein
VGTPCYLIEATGRGKLSLRRFGYGQSSGAQRRHACPEKEPWESGYRPGCDASTGYLEEIAYEPNEDGCWPALAEPSHRDRRWPSVCESCGQPFRHHEVWQANGEPIYRVTAVVAGAALEVGDEVPLRDAPAGAMWIAKWLPEWSRGFDGRGLIVRLPDGHDWRVDGEATNCTRKGDRAHRCWLRDGEPPYVTAGKSGGETCSAGAGSIASPGYHGFLQNGILT